MLDINYIRDVLTKTEWHLSETNRLLRAVSQSFQFMKPTVSMKNISVRREHGAPRMPKKIQLAQDNAVAKVLDESYVVFQHADTSKETAVQLFFVSQDEAKGFDFYVTPVSRWEFIEPPMGPPVPLTFTERAVDNPHGDHSLRIPFLLSQRPIAQLVQVIRGEQPAQPDLKSYLETLMAELAGIVRQAVEASAIRSDIVSAAPFSEGAGYGVDRNCEPSAADTILVRPSYTSIGVPQEE